MLINDKERHMKIFKHTLCSIFTLITLTTQATVVGSWQGIVKVNEALHVELVMHIAKDNNNYSAKLDVPIQQQFGLAFDQVKVTDQDVDFTLSAAGIRYKATLEQGKLVGTYYQGGGELPLVMSKNINVAKVAKRVFPQTPTKDTEYLVREVSFDNKAENITLAGTLTVPKQGTNYVAVLISGSGPSNRNQEIFGHQSFWVLADLLTKQGIAVLRYDDRGVSKSTGDFKSATSYDFAADAKAAVHYVRQLPEFKEAQIGFIGHSEGGLIGALAGVDNKDVDFFVSLAGVGTTGADILIDQSYALQQALGVDEATLQQSDKVQRSVMAAIVNKASAQEIKQLLVGAGLPEQAIKAQMPQITSPWFQAFVQYDPSLVLPKLNMPVLAVNGDLDLQVLAKQNIAGFQKLVNNKQITTKIYSGLNHLFQPAKTGLPKEYAEIDVTFSPQVASDVATWIKSL